MDSGRAGGGMHGGNHGVMRNAMQLVHRYRSDIVRQVENVEGGVMTTTRSPHNRDAARALELHVREMKALLESGGRIRDWDPLFAEIFDRYDEIEMTIEALEDGVRVTETSEDPDVVELIRAHAAKVDQFLARGREAVHEETPLPVDYRRRAPAHPHDPR
ncbi:MAG: hypothetical protein DWQ36_10100 [Acidobacteria bacterium]|nr:MAG: hypothetical protein DWQ30_03145 [Acidobacteriota bacterium]REK08406.1 MAG: hypothetical protein DWQ36_10100 [Acidobacteriota bacterium]